MPTTDYDALSSQPSLINRAVAMHLLREGQFSVASVFLKEADSRPARASHGDVNLGSDTLQQELGIDALRSESLRRQFGSMYYILAELKTKRNLIPAIEWARANSRSLESRGSNLEFELGRLQFVYLFTRGTSDDDSSLVDNKQEAFQYARREFGRFQGRYLPEIQQLSGALAFSTNLADSPYSTIFNNAFAWDELATSFTREFCSLLGLSADSPLYIAATAGAIALPTLLKLQTIMKEKRTEWTTQHELPVCGRIPIPVVQVSLLIFRTG